MAAPARVPAEVFLSHSSNDAEFTRNLNAVFEQHGVSTWYSEEQIRGGQQWHDEIGAALGRCDWFVLVLSPSAVDSKWVKRELLYALGEDRLEGKITPLLYRNCAYKELSWTLPQIQMVDFTRDFREACADLLRIWDIEALPPR